MTAPEHPRLQGVHERVPARLDHVLVHADRPPRRFAVGGVEQHAGRGARRLPLVEDADLVVDELDVAQMRQSLADRGPQRAVESNDRTAARSGLSRAWAGPWPSAVRTKRCEPTHSFTVASVSTRPSARFSAITRQ